MAALLPAEKSASAVNSGGSYGGGFVAVVAAAGMELPDFGAFPAGSFAGAGDAAAGSLARSGSHSRGPKGRPLSLVGCVGGIAAEIAGAAESGWQMTLGVVGAAVATEEAGVAAAVVGA